MGVSILVDLSGNASNLPTQFDGGSVFAINYLECVHEYSFYSQLKVFIKDIFYLVHSHLVWVNYISNVLLCLISKYFEDCLHLYLSNILVLVCFVHIPGFRIKVMLVL